MTEHFDTKTQILNQDVMATICNNEKFKIFKPFLIYNKIALLFAQSVFICM